MFEIFVSREKKVDWLSWLIMFFTRAKFSHIGIIVDGTTIYHSVEQGFCREPLDVFLETHTLPDRFEVRVLNEVQARGYLTGSLGKEYSFSQYIGFVWPRMRRFVRNGKAKGVCSEAALDFGVECCGLKVEGTCLDFYKPAEALEMLRTVKKEA